MPFQTKRSSFVIRCVISDMGRVIISFDNDIFFKKISGYSPFSAEDIAEQAAIHEDFVRLFDTGKITPEEFFEGVTKRLQAEIDQQTFYSIYNDVFSLDPLVLEILKLMKPRYRLVLLSNTDVMRFEFIKMKFPEILIFDDYVVSYQVGYMKPHPQIYIHALEKAGADPQECVFIDDRAENVEAAEKLGLTGILFEPKTDLTAELRQKGLVLDEGRTG
jgi:epoxide hydrolase-like predicted phosphatase